MPINLERVKKAIEVSRIRKNMPNNLNRVKAAFEKNEQLEKSGPGNFAPCPCGNHHNIINIIHHMDPYKHNTSYGSLYW